MIVLYIVIFLIFAIGLTVAVVKIMSTFVKGKSGAADQSENPSITSTTKILPFHSIEDARVSMGGYEYRLYFGIEGTNYMLLSNEGKRSMESGFMRLLTSDLNVAVQYFTHTRKISSHDSLQEVKDQTQDVISKFPDISDLAEKYYDSFSKINIANEKTGEPKTVKSYYAVVIYKPDLDTVNSEDPQSIVDNNLANLAGMMTHSFMSAGVTAHLLNKYEITELFDDVLSRSEDNTGDLLATGTYNAPLVTEEDDNWNMQPLPSDQIKDALNRVSTEIKNDIYSNPLTTDRDIKVSQALAGILEKLKTKISEVNKDE